MHPRPTNGVNTDYATRVGNAIDALDRRLKGNLLDNGAFQVWQRGTSIAATAARTYTADRWVVYRTAFALGATVTQQAGNQAQFCARVQRDNANATIGSIVFVEQIETVNCIPLRGKSITLAFRARAGANYSSSGSALTCAVETGTGTDEANDFVYTGLVATSSVKTLTSVFQDFSLTMTLPSNASEIAVTFSFAPTGTAGAADYFEIEEAQLVVGDFAGNFPYLLAGEERARCEYFFCKSFAYATNPAQNVGAPTGQTNFLAGKAGAVTGDTPTIVFPRRMRAAPAVTLYNPSAANAQVRDFIASVDTTGATALASERGFTISFTGNATTAAGNAMGVHWAASADI
jgi:hypothetical protein